MNDSVRLLSSASKEAEDKKKKKWGCNERRGSHDIWSCFVTWVIGARSLLLVVVGRIASFAIQCLTPIGDFFRRSVMWCTRRSPLAPCSADGIAFNKANRREMKWEYRKIQARCRVAQGNQQGLHRFCQAHSLDRRVTNQTRKIKPRTWLVRQSAAITRATRHHQRDDGTQGELGVGDSSG